MKMGLNILTFNWHEGYIYLLSKTGHNFDIVEREKGGYNGWMYQFRPLPENCRLVTLSEAQERLRQGGYDLIICHNMLDLYDVTISRLPKILIFHTKPTGLFDSKGEITSVSEYMKNIQRLISSEDIIEFVFVSQSKQKLWGIEGKVILPGIDSTEFLQYKGDEPTVLMVGHFLREKAREFGYSELLDETLKGFSVTTMGINPFMENARLSQNWDDLKEQYAQKRLYFNVLGEHLDDGYNLSMLEAMATGMPVVSIPNSTSPLVDGVNGFVSGDIFYLRRVIKQLLDDRDFAEEIGEKGKQIVLERFSIQSFIERWNSLFRSIMDKAAAKRTRNDLPLYSPRIYDCFTFFNELDLLEIRLNTLKDVVDYFVLVESTKTFSGMDKELYFLKNTDRFAAFMDRIIHVVVDDMPQDANRWKREFYQRNAIMRGLTNCNPDDIIIISDVDEIPDPDRILHSFTGEPVALKQRLYYYFLNCEAQQQSKGSVVLRYKDLQSPQWARDKRERFRTIEGGGWHFSYLGGIDAIKRKIENFVHSEYDTPYFKSYRRLYEKVLSGEDIFERDLKYRFVEINESYPPYLIKNLHRFKRLVYIPENSKKTSIDANSYVEVVENKTFRDNLAILREKEPELCDILISERWDSDYRIIHSKSGLPTVRKNEILLHSLYDPEKEAEDWVRVMKEQISGQSTLCVFGFGLGYHIEALTKSTDSDILVFEPDIDLLKIALTYRDLREVLERIRIISNYDIPLIKGGFRILKYNPSLRLQQRYYEIIEDRLRTRRVFQTGLRVAIVGPIYGGSLPIAEYTVKALKRLGHRVHYINNSIYRDAFLFIDNVTRRSDLQNELRNQFMEFASTSVLARCEEQKPDLLIALAQAPLTQKCLEILRRSGLKTAFWFVENYRHLDYWRYLFPHYDYLFVIQKGEFIKHIKETIRKPVHYLPLAASPDIHRPLELTEDEASEYGSDVSFVGAGYKNRREFFTGLIDYDLKIWGNEWDLNSPLGRFIQREGRRVSTGDIVKIFNASKININLHSSAVHSGVDTFGDFINPRTFEIAACRAFQIVDMRQTLSEFFDIGKEIETFKSLNELRKKIDYYLSHPEERVEIAEAGYKRVVENHTYEIRLKEMIDFIMNHDFNLPAWTEKEILVDEITESNRYNTELKEFFKQLKDKGRVTFEEIIEHIRDSEGELSDPEKIFLFMNEVRNQYTRP